MRVSLASFVLLLSVACSPSEVRENRKAGGDPHSFARPDEVMVDHIDLDLTVDFEQRSLAGRASLHVRKPTGAGRLHLDIRDMEIRRVYLDGGEQPARFEIGEEEPFLGKPLVVEIAPDTEVVHVEYATRPEAAALQWLEPRMTAGGRHPFLLTQSQSVGEEGTILVPYVGPVHVLGMEEKAISEVVVRVLQDSLGDPIQVQARIIRAKRT